jgi:hypothetical protein
VCCGVVVVLVGRVVVGLVMVDILGFVAEIAAAVGRPRRLTLLKAGSRCNMGAVAVTVVAGINGSTSWFIAVLLLAR